MICLRLAWDAVRRPLGGAAAPVCWLLVALWAVAAVAQTPGMGSLRGRVVDESGAALAGTEVTIHNQATGLTRTAHSDAHGIYVLPQLPLTGTWQIRFSHDGFAAQERAAIQLRAGETATIDATLKVAGVEAAITVYGTAEGVRSDEPQLGDRFDATQIQEAPLLGRKITALPLLDSAVRPTRTTGDVFLDETLFVVDGGGRRQQSYTIDGGTADDAWGRQTIFTAVPLAAIQELTVLTNSFSAEYGRSAGAAINLVTRQGTNDVHGDILGLVRPGGLDADYPVTGTPVRDNLWQGSGFVSGPLVKDHAYWALGAEYNNESRDSPVTSPLDPTTYTGQYRQSLVFARVDDDLNSSNHLFGRFDLDDFTDSNPSDVVGGLTLPSAGRTFRRDTQALEIGETAVLSPTVFNDARLTGENGDPITQFEPHDPSTQLVRPGVGTAGESRYADLTNRQIQGADTLSLALGDHFLKLGGDLEHSRSGGNGQEFGSPFILGQFTFEPGIPASIPTSQLPLSDVQRFTQGFGNASYTVSEQVWSLYAQDDYHVRRDLVLNVGLRYDRQTLTDATDNISPRLGFAYNPNGDPKTTVRGSWGRYYSELPADTAAQWLLGGPTGFFNYSVAPGQTGFPTSFAPLPGFPAGAVVPARNITIRPGEAAYYSQFFDIGALSGYPDQLLNPHTDQATLGVERQFGNHWFLSVDGVHSKTSDALDTLDLNAPSTFVRTEPGEVRPASAADATRPIVPVNGGYREILVVTNEGEAKYDALQVNLRKTFDGRAEMLLSYTWSHSRNNVEVDGAGGGPNDARNLAAEWADSQLDQRHRAVLSGWYRLPLDLTAGGVATVGSGVPYNITTGADNNGDGMLNDRPVIDGVVIGRNAGRGNTLYDIDLFLERDFKLRGAATIGLRAEVFNVTNHANVYGYNGVYGNNANGQPQAGFGQPLGGVSNADPGRQYQFAVQLKF
jgi:Carboxypeptidase regulatory-like domain/TonB dependent receptor